MTRHNRATTPDGSRAAATRRLVVLLLALLAVPLPLSAQDAPLVPFPAPDASVPVTRRLRGVEARPAKGDLATFMLRMTDGGVTAATIGPLDGRVCANYPSKFAEAAAGMDPQWIPGLIKALRQKQIATIAWVPFNVQDLRNVEDCAPAKRFAEWKMEYIHCDPCSDQARVGMCVACSPYREHHAKLLAEVAAFDFDAIWFDGFYLGGIPHPIAPGCVCPFCEEKFNKESGVALPMNVDWTNVNFKKWVRWRNQKLIETACYFRDAIQKVKPQMPVSMNTNTWPFGDKDWETAVPLWRTTEFGVSQHAYATKPEWEWVMLGYKCRLSKDMNPVHCDVWRPAAAQLTRGGPERNERVMRLFMLAALSYGVAPWHGGHIEPFEAEARVHHEVAKREPYFSRDEVRHVGVWVSQNTHDFYGHIPDTANLTDYRDAVLGTWILLTSRHVPFQFVFDNMVEKGELDGFKVIVAPNVAAMSTRAAQRIEDWTGAGGRFIMTAETSAYDEWAGLLPKPRLTSLLSETAEDVPSSPTTSRFGKGTVHYLPTDPGLAYVRNRDEAMASALIASIEAISPPISVEGPPTLVANTFRSPDKRALFVHLLNVSSYMPNDDTGFRGCRPPAEPKPDTPSDAQVAVPERTSEAEHRIVKDVLVRPLAWKVASARLAVKGGDLPVGAEGRIVVPEVDDHDVLVIEIKQDL